ncbi:putative transcriptional regulator, TetR family [Nocardia nova SH22a]|uniref:Putative transcriptional regulator, TetR family n=1 Tax=Nocardia nova SH22a TaxID=1415166 RepID=W5T859_9NOCA|nr:TetR/AcrR family transcriptional regulator [Nocardia nova]AHH15168.1 putative transcriptional regulator, TetR family [Nocardia nova SH22a]
MTTAQRRYGGRAVAERKAERRDRFLRAATRIFAERGYPNCSLADVCAAAGLSRRQFYEEFATREDVLVAAYDRIQDEAAAAVTTALAEAGGQPTGRAAITTALTAYLASIDSDPYRAKVAFVEVVGVSERMERHRRDRRHLWAQVIDTAIVPLSGPGARTAGPPGLAAGTLIGAVNGLADEWLFRQPRPPVGDLVELLVRVADSLIDRE